LEHLWGDGRSLMPEGWARREKELMPQLDVTEDEKAFHVHVELPGMDQKDVDVTLADRILTIRGEKREEQETKDKDYYRRERSYGSFRRSISGGRKRTAYSGGRCRRNDGTRRKNRAFPRDVVSDALRER
jgi:hypothetical protein